ncbi:hypothetical protein [Peribacillus sp. SCS-155]|uniref:hypothetical protein n=1 Tax=Peribacillus sedimenti TaxID=3115297 RepID=UPI0039062987
MGKSSCRYVVNAVGKGGETYLTHCQDKQELNKWICEHRERLHMNQIKIVDKKRHPFLNWLFNLILYKK